MIGHNDDEIREAAFFALESFLVSLSSKNSDEHVKAALKNVFQSEFNFKSIIYDVLNRSIDQSSTSANCARCFFLLSTFDDFPTPTFEETRIILKIIERSISTEWKLQILIPLWRSIGAFLSRRTIGFETMFNADSAIIFLRFVLEFLRSPYVPLKKETLFVFSEFLKQRIFANSMFDSNTLGDRVEVLTSICRAVDEFSQVSLDREIIGLCQRVVELVAHDNDMRSMVGALRDFIENE